jgi:signal transduction histidine kinase
VRPWRPLPWLLALLALWWCAAAQAIEVRELTHARAAVLVDGQERTADVQLPYHWDRQNRGLAGQAEFELAFAGRANETEPHGLYIPRIGNRAEIWLNGTLLTVLGNVDERNTSDYQKSPQYIPVPPGMLTAHNVLRVRISADIGRRGGLSTIIIGPASEVYPLYRDDFRRRVFVALVVVVFGLLVAALALVLWLTQTDIQPDGRRARDNLYLTAAAAELCWALRIGDIAIEQPPLPWPAWGVLITVAFAGWICCVGLFCHRVAGWHDHPNTRWFRTGMAALFLSSAVATAVALTQGQLIWLTAWLGMANLFFVCYATLYMVGAWRNGNHLHQLVAWVGIINVAMGVRDWLALRISNSYANSQWIIYSSVLFGLALGYIVLSRFREARAQARDLMANLQQRVLEREAELESSWREVEKLALEQERARERARIMRDLHDGVGAHISSAIRQLQTGRADNAVVLQTLSESLDQLKLSVDAMNTPPGDIGAMLASLRYRLEPRFASSDLDLQWRVDPLEPIQRLDAVGMRHVQYMLFEALSNVLQHAQASILSIHATQNGTGTLLRVMDNGKGFDAQQPPRKGLKSMRERAAAIGAALSITSGPGCTVVELTLPA